MARNQREHPLIQLLRNQDESPDATILVPPPAATLHDWKRAEKLIQDGIVDANGIIHAAGYDALYRLDHHTPFDGELARVSISLVQPKVRVIATYMLAALADGRVIVHLLHDHLISEVRKIPLTCGSCERWHIETLLTDLAQGKDLQRLERILN